MTVDGSRIISAQQSIRSAGLDALLVTHPVNIEYLTGLKLSAGAALLAEGRCTVIVDFRYATTAETFARDNQSLAVQVAAGPLDTAIADVVQQAAALKIGVEGEHLVVGRFQRLAARFAVGPLPMDETTSPMLIPTERIIEKLRAVKDASEIETLREAGRMLSAVAADAPQWIAAGLREIDVAARVEEALRRVGFQRPAFETIVASGPNGALPHARPGSRRLGQGEGVVLDFGGVYDGYCVDLTRTLHIGPMSERFRHLFEAVREAHGAAIAAVKPGALPADIDAAARTVLERHGLGEVFGHSTGHGLGLEVHEEPRISKFAPADEPVVAGMVFTIEPGAYLPGIGGVRIEDDVLVTRDGCELLTNVPIDFQETAAATATTRQPPRHTDGI